MPDEPGGELVAQRAIYERQPGETSKAWEAWRTYRDFGISRSLAAVASEMGIDKRRIEEWSSKWRWVDRVVAWEIDQDRLDRMAREKARQEMIERHAALGAAGLAPVFRRLLGHGKEGDDDWVAPLDPNEMDAGDVARHAEVFSRIERGAHGEPVDFAGGATKVPREQV